MPNTTLARPPIDPPDEPDIQCYKCNNWQGEYSCICCEDYFCEQCSCSEMIERDDDLICFQCLNESKEPKEI